MNKEELELLDYVFSLAYSECMSKEVNEIGKLKEKILNIEERIGKAIEYLETNYFIVGRSKDIYKILKGENNE